MSVLGQAKVLAKIAQGNITLPPDFDIEAAMATEGITGLKPLQEKLDGELKRFNVLVMHRRFGKTVMCVRRLIKKAWLCPFLDGRYAYLAPTYSQAEDIAWSYLKSFTEKIPGNLVQESKLAVWIPTKRGSRARIRLYGVDSPKQRLRGLYLDGCVEDEFPEFPPSVWTEQVRPMLSDSDRHGVDEDGDPNQWDIKIGTPKGRNYFHTMYRRADMWSRGEGVVIADPETGVTETVFREDYYAALYRASETGILTATELKSARLDQGPAKYDQEYECSFDAAVEGAIYARMLEAARQAGRVVTFPVNPMLGVYTGWDLGWDDATAIWFAQMGPDGPRLIDYYEASGYPLEHYADVLEQKDYRYIKHFLPHDVETTELGSGKSRKSILQRLGVRVTTVKRHVPWDGIAVAQALIPTCWFHEGKCSEGLDRLALYRREYDERRQVFREKPLHDWASHGADAFRSLAMGLRAGNLGGGLAALDPNTTRSSVL